jgi:hypothetical protein
MKIYPLDPVKWLDEGRALIVPVTSLEHELGKKTRSRNPRVIFGDGKVAASSFADTVGSRVVASDTDADSHVSEEYKDSDGTVATIRLTWAGTVEGSSASQPGSTQEASSS